MMKRSALSLLVLFLWAAPAVAQPNPAYVFSVTNGSGAAGSIVEVQVLADNTGENVDGWSFGVCSDPTELSVAYVEPGEIVENFNGGAGPFFYVAEIFADGFNVGLVVN